MRIVTKVNLTLVAAAAAAALLNFAALRATVLPSFEALERAGADRNETLALEAVSAQEREVASVAGDYAVWDETYAFLNGRQPNYPSRNMTPEAMRSLGVDFVALIDARGRVLLDRSFADGGAVDAGLLGRVVLPPDHPLRASAPGGSARFGLMAAPAGLAAVAYAPVYDSAGEGASPGVILFGRILDVAALKGAAQVEIRLEPPAEGGAAPPRYLAAEDALETRETLAGLDGRPVAVLVARTPSRILALGETAIGSATGLILLSMLVVVACVGIALRRIAVRRIERIRTHLAGVTATGALDPMPFDGAGDELSDTTAAFNAMAAQLSQLRAELRRRDYRHGAADLAAGLLHNIRAAVSPVAAIAWDRDRPPSAPSAGPLARALGELGEADEDSVRAARLKELIALSAGGTWTAGADRLSDLRVIHEMIRHVEEILRDEDRLAQPDGAPEILAIDEAVCRALRRIHRLGLGLVARTEIEPGAATLAPRFRLDPLLDALLVKAAETAGRLLVAARVRPGEGAAVVEICLSEDDSEAAPSEPAGARPAPGSAARTGGPGLDWCETAAQDLGGRLVAETDRLTLTLPAATLRRQSAA